MLKKIFLLCAIISLLISENAIARQDDVERVLKLSKSLHYTSLDDARAELSNNLLVPPIKLGSKKDEVHGKLGNPKEVYGFGSEYFQVKDATVTVSYTTDDKGEVIANIVEYHPKKDSAWTYWLKSNVQLPSPPPSDTKSKIPVRLTTQIRIENYGDNKSLQITMIGDQRNVTSVQWSLIL
jgi:hypothetical protein